MYISIAIRNDPTGVRITDTKAYHTEILRLFSSLLTLEYFRSNDDFIVSTVCSNSRLLVYFCFTFTHNDLLLN